MPEVSINYVVGRVVRKVMGIVELSDFSDSGEGNILPHEIS